jgi:hypothetical protein
MLVGVGVALGLYGVALLAAPGAATSFWPWAPDDFAARLYSGAFLACAAGAFLLHHGGARREWLTMGLTLVLLGALPIAGIVSLDLSLHRVDWARLGPQLWLGAFGVLAAAGLVVLRQGMAVAADADDAAPTGVPAEPD